MRLVQEHYIRLQRDLFKTTKVQHPSSSLSLSPHFIQNAAYVMVGASAAIINPETMEWKACGEDERVLFS